MTATAPARAPARDRLLAAANELFYAEGINNVGIDRVIEHAGVAKASLYANFRSKDELVRAYLESRHEARKARMLERIERHRSARERALAVFDSVAETVAQPGYRGCPFMRAASEQPGEGPAAEVNAKARGWLRELFTSLLREAGARNAPAVAQQFVLLFDGAVVAAQLDGNVDAVRTARTMAASLLAASSQRGTRM
ncbi:TetR/AcrR family transcriptional regulator [Schlegelella sp. S2-27]|uniref:TetR/AcrR family transcriptional regulator n=1 Tax=Caldimonas mangrovi TaxID=2944811 RepID=A0ABT0YVW5_9BURK|nr:TetR/AcrR family transcriptional regulator [Caldimonas mangrovi]MCM5682887.1 TetR/AcrR family transcriptional regulator [Caldimonas mangrovi]